MREPKFQLVKIQSQEGAMRWGKGWELEAQHQAERAAIYELLYEAYRLQLRVAERELERLRAGG